MAFFPFLLERIEIQSKMLFVNIIAQGVTETKSTITGTKQLGSAFEFQKIHFSGNVNEPLPPELLTH